jgi:hypothetical protein
VAHDGERPRRRSAKKPQNPSFHSRFKEAWAWYREDWKSRQKDAPDPQERGRSMAIFGIIFLVGLAFWAAVRGTSFMAVAMPLALAGLLYVQEKLGLPTGTPGQYRRATNWMQMIVLLLMLIALASDILPKYF